MNVLGAHIDIDIGGWALGYPDGDRPRDRPPAHSGSPSPPFEMRKRKAKTTLTKIDPGVLEPKSTAFSYHEAHDGRRVTTALNPVLPAPTAPEVDSFVFNADLPDFDESRFEDNGNEEEDISRGYYVARVRIFLSRSIRRLIGARIIRSYYGGPNVGYTLEKLSNSKVAGYLPTANVNSAAKRACTVASIALGPNSFAEAA